MASSPVNVNRLIDASMNFMPGVDSNQHPALLLPGQSSWAVNLQNRGGTWRLRDGFKSLVRLPDGRPQGITLFTPTGGVVSLVVALAGRIWTSPFPFVQWDTLPNIQFNPFVDHIVFKEAIQAINAGTLIDPKSVLMMQDGRSKPAYWDGQVNRHLNPGGSSNETVQGMWMEFVGGRLWVSRGAEIFASDIYDPLHFTETLYLSGGGSLVTIDGKAVTALARTADSKALLAYTLDNTTIIAAAITDRLQWQTTPGFISILFPGVGCVGGKSITYSNGELFWFSKEGARRFTQVGATIQVSRNNIASLEMKRSFANLSPVTSRTCAFGFNGFVGFSVPSGDVYNRHTWVIDMDTSTSSINNAPPAWQGIWMGTRPIEWATGMINGKDRCFHVSQDKVCGVHVWEAFQPNQLDDGKRIFFSLEGRGMDFQSPLAFKKFLYSEFHLFNLLGQLDLTVDFKGDYSCWKNIATLILCAQECNQLNCDTQNQAAARQSRYFKTAEAPVSCDLGIGPYQDNVGTYFQTRIRGYGRFGLLKTKSSANQFQEGANAECPKGDVDSDGNVVCKTMLCCDPEIDYMSVSDLCPYGSGSENAVVGSL